MKAKAPLRITYVLEDTSLFGGVKAVLQQAQLLQAKGHHVTVVSPGAPPKWFPGRITYLQIPRLDPSFFPFADVTVATYWTTLPSVAAYLKGEKVHFCQGFEGSYTHNQTEHQQIWQVYRLGLPAFAVAPHLVTFLLGTFQRPAKLVSPSLDLHFRPALWRRRPHSEARILVFHPYEADWKGVRTALLAIRILRSWGIRCFVVRIAQTPQHPEEGQITFIDHYLKHLRPVQVARIVRRCDLLLAPSWEQEAFGLPLLEAMASGVPAVASDISAFRFLTQGAVPLVSPTDATAFAEEARALLTDPRRWRLCAAAGRARAQDFHPTTLLPKLEEAFYWVASGAWREETLSTPSA